MFIGDVVSISRATRITYNISCIYKVTILKVLSCPWINSYSISTLEVHIDKLKIIPFVFGQEGDIIPTCFLIF